MNSSKDHPEVKFVPKGWGYEKWFVNKKEYCGKLLFFAKGKKCSLHYHKLKDETFYIHKGCVEVKWTDQKPDEHLMLKYTVLRPGDTFYIPPGRIHQMIAYEDTELFEFSTEHFDEDSYRIVKGD